MECVFMQCDYYLRRFWYGYVMCLNLMFIYLMGHVFYVLCLLCVVFCNVFVLCNVYVCFLCNEVCN